MKEAQRAGLLSKYPWLAHTTNIDDYIAPEYYKRLLKQYTFHRKQDLEYFNDCAKQRKIQRALELGSGGGRVTRVFNRLYPTVPLTLVDLSRDMIQHTSEIFSSRPETLFVQSDAIEFMRQTEDVYDFVYTLWSFSHSTHQHLHRLGYIEGRKYLYRIIQKFIEKNISPGGTFFLMHFDSMSPEQRILMRQWRRVYPVFADVTQQSPSKRILDDVFTKLDNQNTIRLSSRHYRGDAITYRDQEELLEVFMNFHLEMYFNDSGLTSKVLNDIIKQAEPYRNDEGGYAIAPGCYIYTFTKMD